MRGTLIREIGEQALENAIKKGSFGVVISNTGRAIVRKVTNKLSDVYNNQMRIFSSKRQASNFANRYNKEATKADNQATTDADKVAAGTKKLVRGAGKSRFSRRERTKPTGTETLLQRPKGSIDPKTGKPRGGQFPKRGEAGAVGSKTREKSKELVKQRKDRTLTKIILGILGFGGAGAALLSNKVEYTDDEIKQFNDIAAGDTDMSTGARNKFISLVNKYSDTEKSKEAAKKLTSNVKDSTSKKKVATNRQVSNFFSNIDTLNDPDNPELAEVTLKVGDKTKTFKDAKEYTKAWNKEFSMPKGEDSLKMSSIIKRAVSEKKKGGGQVSNRPKPYRTAKVMKRYANGGSIRKPNRV